MTCFLTSRETLKNGEAGDLKWVTHKLDDSCKPVPVTVLICGLLPLWFRFAQCIHKYYESGHWFPNLLNAGKYSFGLVNVYLSYLYGNKQIPLGLAVTWATLSTLYSYAWDLIMDWGLLRGSGSNFFLRDRLFYPKWTYYFSVVTNFILRFIWILPLCYKPESGLAFDMDVMFFILCLAELYRRAQWSLFRVENENINNYEKYRVIQDIPRVEEEFEDEL